MAKINKHLPACLGLLIIPLYSHGASFDCAKAGTWVEKAICSNPQLSDLDELLMASYKKALSGASNAATLKTAQKDWLKNSRDGCQDTACLKQAYTTRLAELNQLVSTSTKPLSIAGKYERYYRGKPDNNSAHITILELKDGKVHINGEALWVGNAETGNVNVGNLEGSFPLHGNTIHYTDGEAEGCRLTLAFIPKGLVVSDDNTRCGGMNVSFDGQYRKTGEAK